MLCGWLMCCWPLGGISTCLAIWMSRRLVCGALCSHASRFALLGLVLIWKYVDAFWETFLLSESAILSSNFLSETTLALYRYQFIFLT
jgi:hypothetical protein